MIELRNNRLEISFPQVHESARLTVSFQRTLRLPDDGQDYPLPPGLGAFPLRHVDDFAQRAPAKWIKHGGVMLPMYQSEAMWLNFSSPHGYPFAVKVATGKVSAITGKSWRQGLSKRPQNYLSIPEQPWLDGYVVEKGTIRQFVAMPLGAGYSAEEQITGRAEVGGLQLAVYPLKAELFEPIVRQQVAFSKAAPMPQSAIAEMGLAPGGRMRQQIYKDPYRLKDWQQDQGSRCFVHIANSLTWRAITGQNPPTTPFTAEEYTRRGFPWFDYYNAEADALAGADPLAALKSVAAMGKERGELPLPENSSVDPAHIIQIRKGLKEDQVREGEF